VVSVRLDVLIALLDISKTIAGAVLAFGAVISARTAAPETILSSLDALAIDHLVDKPEVFGQNFIVDFIHHGNRDSGVGLEGADLAPVTVMFLILKALASGMLDEISAICDV
jgi:hypothetical protein